MAIQQAINQLIGSAYQATAFKTHLDQQKASVEEQERFRQEEAERAEYNKPENVKARRIEELTGKIKPQIEKGEDREKALIAQGWSLEEAQLGTMKDLADEQALYEELYDLTGDKTHMEHWAEIANLADYYKTELSDKQKAQVRANEEIARKEKEKQQKEEEARQFDEKTSQFARDTINQAQRELRTDWQADAMAQIRLETQFKQFLDDLENTEWANK